METICGADCTKCQMKDTCKGCIQTNGHPFGGNCVMAICCSNNKYKKCSECTKDECKYKEKLINEFNSLNIKDMPKVKELFQLNGCFVNLEYTLPNGIKIKFLEDNNIYLGTQLEKENSDRCYGLIADDNYILICEYSKNGLNPEIVLYKKR